MIKKNQFGSPCDPNMLFAKFAEPSPRCLRAVVYNVKNGTCDCCADINGLETYSQIIYVGALGFRGVFNKNPTCQYVEGVSATVFDQLDFCDCTDAGLSSGGLYGVDWHFERWCNLCEHIATLYMSYSLASVRFGWTLEQDDQAAMEALVRLANGETVILPVLDDGSEMLNSNCDFRSAFVGLTLVDCPDPQPYPGNDCDDCLTFLTCVSDSAPEVHLSLRDFEDCVDPNPIFVVYETMSVLNGTFTLTTRAAAPSICTGLTGSGNVWGAQIGTDPDIVSSGDGGDYDDLGERTRQAVYFISPDDDWPSPTYTYSVEDFVYDIAVVAGCQDYLNLYELKYVTTLVAQYIVIRDAGDNVVFWSLLGSPTCVVYRQLSTDSLHYNRQCAGIYGDNCFLLGNGAVDTWMDYTLCGNPVFEFLATLVISGGPAP